MTLHANASDNHNTVIMKNVHEFFSRFNKPLYSLIDTARDRRTFSLIEESGCEYQILYGKELALTMDGRGPHLISLNPGTPFLERLIKAGWGNSWGIFITGPTDLKAVRRHLRRLLSVKLDDGRQALFRFYDPRILRDYLPSCTDDELAHFFGPIDSIYLESDTGRELLYVSYDRSPQMEPLQSTRLIQHSLKLF